MKRGATFVLNFYNTPIKRTTIKVQKGKDGYKNIRSHDLSKKKIFALESN